MQGRKEFTFFRQLMNLLSIITQFFVILYAKDANNFCWHRLNTTIFEVHAYEAD